MIDTLTQMAVESNHDPTVVVETAGNTTFQRVATYLCSVLMPAPVVLTCVPRLKMALPRML
jgi:hypothetical protein